MIHIYAISDSTGETVNTYIDSLMIQFPHENFSRRVFSNVDKITIVDQIFSDIQPKTIIAMTVVIGDVAEKIKEYARINNCLLLDLLNEQITRIENFIGERALRLPGLMRDLNNEYFDKIESIEFAMNYDDGKNPKGFLMADIVLVGVSRTSKTPLSMFLANKKYKVANLPLLPELALPEEIFKVDKNKIIGLIIDPDKLNKIRQQRLTTLGLGDSSSYANQMRISEELDYAKKVFEKLGCKVINVTGLTIESIAGEIINYINN